MCACIILSASLCPSVSFCLLLCMNLCIQYIKFRRNGYSRDIYVFKSCGCPIIFTYQQPQHRPKDYRKRSHYFFWLPDLPPECWVLSVKFSLAVLCLPHNFLFHWIQFGLLNLEPSDQWGRVINRCFKSIHYTNMPQSSFIAGSVYRHWYFTMVLLLLVLQHSLSILKMAINLNTWNLCSWFSK